MLVNRGWWVPVLLVVAGVLASGQPSHIQGTSRRIRMFVKNAFLQVGPETTVVGTQDDTSVHTILQRTSVAIGKVKIQSVHSCLYLCMDTCGMPYSSKEYWDECIFNEMMESNHYNTYSSGKYSNGRRTLYLALNRMGEPRRVQIRGGGTLGKLSAYTRVLTQPVPPHEGAQLKRCRSGGPPSQRETASCLRRPGPPPGGGRAGAGGGRRRRRRCRPGEVCPQARRRRPPPAGGGHHHPRRHRKHRTLAAPAPDQDDLLDDESAEDDNDFAIDNNNE